MRVAQIASGAAVGALVALAACADLFGPAGPELFVSLNLQQPSTGTARLAAIVGGKRVEVRSADTPEAQIAWRGPRFGNVPVRVALLDTDGDTLAHTAFTMRFERDHVHWIAARVGSRRPLGRCVGALTVLPLAGATTDTLFLAVGLIPKGAIC